jgi:CENP-B N-terminal DNA-binding domain
MPPSANISPHRFFKIGTLKLKTRQPTSNNTHSLPDLLDCESGSVVFDLSNNRNLPVLTHYMFCGFAFRSIFTLEPLNIQPMDFDLTRSYSRKEVAHRLNCCERTLYTILDAQKIGEPRKPLRPCHIRQLLVWWDNNCPPPLRNMNNTYF